MTHEVAKESLRNSIIFWERWPVSAVVRKSNAVDFFVNHEVVNVKNFSSFLVFEIVNILSVGLVYKAP